MADRVVAQTIYRSLLRSARAIDTQPAGRALLSLSTKPGSYFNRKTGRVEPVPQDEGIAGALGSLLRGYLGGGEFYRPGQSLEAAVRAARRSPPAHRPLDVGIAALRVLGEAAERMTAVAEHLMDAERCEAVVRPLGRVVLGKVVRPGSLLVTHPLACMMQPSLHRAVILITSVTETSVLGLVINKSLGTKVGAVVTDEGRDMLGPILAAATLHKGGDVAEGQIAALHDLAGVPGAQPIGCGLWLSSSLREGELRHALACEAGERLSLPGSPRVKLVHGCAGWAPAQLQSELDRAVWFLVQVRGDASVAPLALLQQADATDTAGDGSEGRGAGREGEWEGGQVEGGDERAGGGVESERQVAEPEESVGQGGEAGADQSSSAGGGWLCDTLWAGVLRQLGGGYADLARFPALDASTTLGARLLRTPPP
eukprot:scaffold1507_cov134-Isochrysis_galbana.AAC.2